MNMKIRTKNCPNCSAPYDISFNKCPYCNTSYFDLSCIDINDREPFYLKLKVNNMVITQKVIVNSDCSIELSEDNLCVCDRNGNKLHNIIKSRGALTSLSFTALPDYKDGKTILFTIEREEKSNE